MGRGEAPGAPKNLSHHSHYILLSADFASFPGQWGIRPAAPQPGRDRGGGAGLGRAASGGDETPRLHRGGQSVCSARAQRFEPFREGAPIPIGGGQSAIGITGWTGGAYCCWTLHLFRRGDGGLAHVASLPLGKREPAVIRLAPPGGPAVLLADAGFDFWDAPMSRAADLHPTIPFRWNGRALVPDRAAMRRSVAAALGGACIEMAAPEGVPPPEARQRHYPGMEAAIAALRAADWSGRAEPHPGVEAARLAACLVYAGHAREARRLLREAWPEGVRGLAETEAQMAARLACSPFVAALRAVNGAGAPFMGARCEPNGAAQAAVFEVGWR